MTRFTWIFLFLICYEHMETMSAIRNDDREILEKLIETLIEAKTVPREILRAEESTDGQTLNDNQINDEELKKSIKILLQSERARDEKQRFNEVAKQETFDRQWITADAGFRGTETTTTTTTRMTTTPPSTTQQTTAPPSGRTRKCIWLWFRRFCFYF